MEAERKEGIVTEFIGTAKAMLGTAKELVVNRNAGAGFVMVILGASELCFFVAFSPFGTAVARTGLFVAGALLSGAMGWGLAEASRPEAAYAPAFGTAPQA